MCYWSNILKSLVISILYFGMISICWPSYGFEETLTPFPVLPWSESVNREMCSSKLPLTFTPRWPLPILSGPGVCAALFLSVSVDCLQTEFHISYVNVNKPQPHNTMDLWQAVTLAQVPQSPCQCFHHESPAGMLMSFISLAQIQRTVSA